MKFVPPDEKVLKIVVKAKEDFNQSISKESMIKDKLIDEYDTTKNEFFIRVEA